MNNKHLIEDFWIIMNTNDFHAAANLLHDDYTLEWPQSGERIRGRHNFVLINSYYPADGKWTFRINHILADGDTVFSDVMVSDGKRHDRCITISTVKDEKIWKQIEFWPEPFPAPEWRAMWVEKT